MAIIHENHRPIIDIADGSFESPTEGPWAELGNASTKSRIERVLKSVGRLEVPSDPRIPYAGTAFVVGPNLLMTCRHAAEIFAQGVGRFDLEFRPGLTAAIDFGHENTPSNGKELLHVNRIVMIHPYWDMALLEVRGLTSKRPPLPISATPPDESIDRKVVLVGYPTIDFRHDREVQNRILRGVLGSKRLQPGKLLGSRHQTDSRARIGSFGNDVDAIAHDASTLGGNGGSPVIDIESGEVIGMNFAGRYLESNYAVPMSELARDRRVVEAGLNFQGSLEFTHDWDHAWRAADPPARRHPLSGGTPPDWCESWGQDRQGVWADLSIEGASWARDGVSQRMRWIPPGRLFMGRDEFIEEDAKNWPRHEVLVSDGYWIFDTLSSIGLWNAVMNANSAPPPSGPKLHISWDECQVFVERINEWKPGLNLALPTEAMLANACDGNMWGVASPPLNSAEWCLDSLRDFNESPQTDPFQTHIPDSRTVRWNRDFETRESLPVDTSDSSVGFRCVSVGDSVWTIQNAAFKINDR